jgi:hypothetical protein
MGCSYCALKLIWLFSTIILCGSGLTAFLLILIYYQSNQYWLVLLPFAIGTIIASAFTLFSFLYLKKEEEEEFDDDEIK